MHDFEKVHDFVNSSQLNSFNTIQEAVSQCEQPLFL